MMDLDDIFALTKEMTASVTVPTVEDTPPAPPKVAKIVTKKPTVRVCTACSGTGMFTSPSGWKRACFRCKPDYEADKGLGYITEQIAERNARYDEAVTLGVKVVSYAVHEKKQGDNVWVAPTSYASRR